VDVTAGDDYLDLYDKEVDINMGPILNGSEVMGVFICRQGPPVNRALHFTLPGLEPAGTGTVSRNCNS